MKQNNIARWFIGGIAAAVAVLSLLSVTAGPATRVAKAIWANDQLFDTILTDAQFKNPPAGSTDVLFNFDASGLKGQRSVAEAAPGDPEYNGGRWHVYAVTFTATGKTIHDPDNDGVVNFELTNAEAVLHHAQLGHLTITDTGFYFECPLLRSRN